MKHVNLFILILVSFSVFSQKTTDTIASQKMGEDRVIYIKLPDSYGKNKAQKYPLLLVLDGDFLFEPFEGNISYGNYWDDLPELIIVGISQNKNNERETDCTFKPITGLLEEKGEQFFEFIGMELVPYLQKKYRVAPFKIIAGLDTTAGFLNFFLYKNAPLFNAYISMSPELPTGMEEQIPERLAAIQQPLFYYHSTADGDVKKMRDRIKILDEAVSKINKPTLNYRFEEFKGSSHYSLVLHSIPSALYQIFSVYQPISIAEFNEKIAVLPSGYVDYLIQKYDVLENALGLKLQIRVTDFKAIEAAILKNKAYNEFDQLAQLARKNYPKSMLADYEMAQLYEKKGDNKRAAKSYQNAFQMEEIGDLTKDMMLNKADELRNAVQYEKEEVIEEAPAETPTEVPAEKTKDEKKPEECPK
jgi:predicted alpha/beta superfamily hydrolase